MGRQRKPDPAVAALIRGDSEVGNHFLQWGVQPKVEESMHRPFLPSLLILGVVCVSAQDPTRTLRPQQASQPVPECTPAFSLVVGTDLSVPIHFGQSSQEAQQVAIDKSQRQAMEKAQAYFLKRVEPSSEGSQAAFAGASCIQLGEPLLAKDGEGLRVRSRWEIRFAPQAIAPFFHRVLDRGWTSGYAIEACFATLTKCVKAYGFSAPATEGLPDALGPRGNACEARPVTRVLVAPTEPLLKC